MDKLIMWIMACCALVGGIDRILGNRFGFGKRFEDGFMLMGPTALSMVGIICLVPMISNFLSSSAAPLCHALNLDPSILSGLIAIDMGGYQLAQELALTSEMGNFSGIIIAAMLGCTVSFTIPVGMGMLDMQSRRDFAKGILFGLISLPVGLTFGGIMCGLTPAETLKQSLPIFILSALIMLGIWKKTAGMIRGFSIFAKCISIITTIGLSLGAFTYMTGYKLLPGLAPIEDAMAVAASIAVVMLGSLPFSELLQRILKRPLAWFGTKTGMNSASAAGLLVGTMSVLPAIALVKDMDRRGRIVNAAFMVCAASSFAAHLGFVAGVNVKMTPALLVSKLAGGCVGAVIALLATRKG